MGIRRLKVGAERRRGGRNAGGGVIFLALGASLQLNAEVSGDLRSGMTRRSPDQAYASTLCPAFMRPLKRLLAPAAAFALGFGMISNAGIANAAPHIAQTSAGLDGTAPPIILAAAAPAAASRPKSRPSPPTSTSTGTKAVRKAASVPLPQAR